MDLHPAGIALLGIGLSLGVLAGLRAAKSSIIAVDVPNQQVRVRTGRSAILSIIAVGAVTLLLTNLFYAQMLRLTNAGLMMGIGSVSAQRLSLFLAYLRERRQSEELVGMPPQRTPEPQVSKEPLHKWSL